ncbi:MAG: beta-glucuronidase [Sphingomonadales bacterium]|nr:beta-glucuronidase [Sphingomonadales bacterium]
MKEFPDRRTAIRTIAAITTAMAAFPAARASNTAATPDRLSPTAPLLGLMSARSKIALDGPWHYLIDPYDTALGKPHTRRAVWEDRSSPEGRVMYEYEWDSSPVMQVPTDWNSASQELYLYDGIIYLHRDVALTPKPGRRQIIRFEAVNYHATIWLGGLKIGDHEGGFLPFEFDVTEYIDQLGTGNHPLVLRVDSRHSRNTIPGADFDWKNWGGITRSVYLIDTAESYVRNAAVRFDGSAIIVDVFVTGSETIAATVAFPELGLQKKLTIEPSGSQSIRFPIGKKAQRWSPESPKLYRMEISANGETLHDAIGLRTIETRGRELLLNGKPVYLRGICIHEEPISKEAGRTVTLAQARALLDEAKALGCNFVRLAHYPHSEHMLRLADEMGLLVWSEIPIYWEDIDYKSERIYALADQMLTDMIERDRNRASIILWSVANETPQSEGRNIFLRRLIARCRALDPARLVTAAMNKNADMGGSKPNEARIVVQDALAAELDVIGINQYQSWYGPRSPGDLNQVTFSSAYDKPLIFSEFVQKRFMGIAGRAKKFGPKTIRPGYMKRC